MGGTKVGAGKGGTQTGGAEDNQMPGLCAAATEWLDYL